MSEKFEKLFKTALEQVTVEPPERVWKGIHSHFVLKQRHQRRVYTASAVAAAIALLWSLGYFIQNEQNNLQVLPPVVGMNQDIKTQGDNKILAFTSTSPTIPASTRKVTRGETIPRSTDISPVTLSTRETWENGLTGEQPEGNLKTPALRSDFIPLVNQNAVENQQAYDRLLSGKEKNVIQKTKISKDNKFMVGGYVAPGYTTGNYHSSNNNTRSAQYDGSQMSGILNVGGGLTFAVKPTKRISIETGVGYARMGQKTNDAPVFVPQAGMVAYNNTTHAYTPLGNVKNQATATVSTPESFVDLKGAHDQNGSIEQQFDAIEVPLIFRYRLNDNRVRFSILGGFGASFMVRNNTYVTYNGTKELMGKAEEIRTFNISTNIGFGVEYPITKRIHILFEPGFKYYLQSLTKSADIDFKPYTFTFSTGIGINF